MYRKVTQPGILHDVFISYAHVDNERTDKDQLAWVEQLEHDLAIALGEKFGRKNAISLWRDPRLNGHDFLLDVLREACSASALLLAVLTPGYMQSDWCFDRELRTFAQSKIGTEGAGGKLTSVLRVDRSPISLEAQQRIRSDADLGDFVDGMIGYRFCEYDRVRGKYITYPRKLRHADADQRYWDQVEKLAEGVIEALQTLGIVVSEQPSPAPVPKPKPAPPVVPANVSVREELLPKGSIVYLAETADDVSEHRAQLVRELEGRGMLVVPRRRLPIEEDDFRRVVLGLLSGELDVHEQPITPARPVRLAVHPLGSYYGSRVGESSHSLAHLQYEIARSYFEKTGEGRQMVWMPASEVVGPLVGLQKELLSSILQPVEKPVPEVFQGSYEIFKDELLQKLAQPAKLGQSSKRYTPLVLVAYPAADESLAARIEEYMKSREVNYMADPGVDGDNDRELSFFSTAVGVSDGVLIVYDSAEKRWVNTRVLKAQDIAQERRRRPLSASCVYECPPQDRLNLGFEIDGWLIVNCRDGHALDRLDPFIEKVRSRN